MAEAATPATTTPGFFASFLNLEFGRQLGLMVGLAGSVAVGVAVALWSMEGDYRPLYNSLESVDSANVIDVLESSEIDYRRTQQADCLARSQLQGDVLQNAASAQCHDDFFGFQHRLTLRIDWWQDEHLEPPVCQGIHEVRSDLTILEDSDPKRAPDHRDLDAFHSQGLSIMRRQVAR